jgi:YcaO-like protein with predicted kinase domain
LNRERRSLCCVDMSAIIPGPERRTPKGYRQGTDRIVGPEQTLANLRPFLDDFGVTRIADVTGMDCIGIPTVMVVRPNSRSVSVSQGKGVDLATAKVSGLMESIEQFHAEHVLNPLRLANLNEIRAIGAVADVERLPGFKLDFDATQRVLWIAGQDLATEAEIWVPFEAVHLDLRLPLPTGSGFFMSGSNGLASGNHRLEAVSHGLCELIERDALSLFFQSDAPHQRRRRVELATVDDPICRELLTRYREAEMDVAVWDMTSDLGIPCFLCWILESADDVFRPVGLAQGSGCHPTRGIALSRALSEAAQSRVTRIVGSRDDIRPKDLLELRAADALELYRAQMSEPEGPCRAFQSTTSYSFDTFEEDVELLIARLHAAGLTQVIGVDLSRPQYPVHVMRLLVPGLEGAAYLPGYRPGRRAAAQRARRTAEVRS